MERIISAASRLFAALGYDATTMAQIAEAAELDIDTVMEIAGSKRELYLAVMGRGYTEQKAVLEGALARIDESGAPQVAASIHALIDDYLEFCLNNPDISALLMHRWLGDAADLRDLEQIYNEPLVNSVLTVFNRMAEAGLLDSDADVELCVRTIAWTTIVFVRYATMSSPPAGFLAGERTVARFRVHLHRLSARMLGLAPTSPAETPP
ncbi:helix-turn-helix domain-containing protein [Nonomuraea sp. NPDC026600]|uniref:TetR/AcrR family transcriptional regulator n=1 Tax=Nonomuraea sp. NPDC026600 TaxID=3155363 RepID=UPI0033F4DF73